MENVFTLEWRSGTLVRDHVCVVLRLLEIAGGIFRILENRWHFDSVAWLHLHIEQWIRTNFVHIDYHKRIATKQSDFSYIREF
jgi:hypothetical protein